MLAPVLGWRVAVCHDELEWLLICHVMLLLSVYGEVVPERCCSGTRLGRLDVTYRFENVMVVCFVAAPNEIG